MTDGLKTNLAGRGDLNVLWFLFSLVCYHSQPVEIKPNHARITKHDRSAWMVFDNGSFSLYCLSGDFLLF